MNDIERYFLGLPKNIQRKLIGEAANHALGVLRSETNHTLKIVGYKYPNRYAVIHKSNCAYEGDSLFKVACHYLWLKMTFRKPQFVDWGDDR